MLRKSLIALALLAASGGAMAGGDYVYGRVVVVEPNFSISFGSGGYRDGYRILYEFGGHRYWTHSHRHPGAVIWVPRPVVVGNVYRYRPHYRHDYRHDYRHERGERRHDWEDRRRDRWDERRDDRRDWRRDH